MVEFGRYFRDRRGNVAVIFAVTAIPLVFLTGAAVDYGRASALRARLQNAVDGTALTLCQTPLTTTNAALDAQAVSLVGAYMPEGATVTTPLPVTSNPRQITVKASGSFTTSFTRILGVQKIPVDATSQCATPMPQTFEIGIALDTTGSMNNSGGSGTKLAAAQQAAKNFIDYVYSNNAFSADTKISLVPFASGVAVDPNTYGASTIWIDGGAKSSFHWNNVSFASANATVKAKIKNRFDIFAQLKTLNANWGWAGCLETLPYPLNVNDAAPAITNPDSYFVPMLAPDEPGGDTKSYSVIAKSANDTSPKTDDRYSVSSGQTYANSYLEDHTNQSGCDAATMNPQEAGMRACKYYGANAYSSSSSNWIGVANGPNFLCTSKPLQRLTNDTTKLKALITSLVASGSTNIFEGFMWAWRTISPISVFAEAAPYNSNTVRKVLILMTDGENTWNTNSGLGLTNAKGSLYGPMGYVTNDDGTTVAGASGKSGRLITGTANPTNDTQSRAAIDALTQQACTNAKAQGIAVYTIGFSTSSDAIDKPGLALLQNCASSSAQAYVANDSTGLITAFEQIAKSIGKLRITR
ncbi:pilus assembly protein TadG-related protein [Methylobacterium sp. A54F]